MSWLCLNLNIVLEDLFVITIGFIDDNFVLKDQAKGLSMYKNVILRLEVIKCYFSVLLGFTKKLRNNCIKSSKF